MTDQARQYEYEKGQEDEDEEPRVGNEEGEDDEFKVGEDYEDEKQSDDDSICDVYDSCDEYDYDYDDDEY